MTSLGDFSSGDVLTAADLNAIGTWQNYTPNIISSSGTLGSVSVYEAKYTQINQLVVGTLFWKVTSVGSGSGSFKFDLPVTWAGYSVGTTADAGFGAGRENQTTGKMFSVLGHQTYAYILYYDNSNPVAAGVGGGVFFTYRAA